MLEVWTECIMDIVKTIPILFVVYLVISWMENHMDAVTRVVTSTEPAGPVIHSRNPFLAAERMPLRLAVVMESIVFFR